MSKTPEISIIVPVRDEAGNIAPLIAELAAAFQGRAIELIYVNDASTDATDAELRGAQANHPFLRIITHRHHAGQSAALRSGILGARSALIATLDGDGQNLPADLRLLEEAWHQEKKRGSTLVMVAGMREKRYDTWSKRLASKCAKHLRLWLLGDQHPDSGCGIKIFDRALFLRLPYFDHIHRFMPILARREGAAVLAVPVRHRPRGMGKSKYRIVDRAWVGVLDIMGVWWLMRRAAKLHNSKEAE